MTGTPGIKARQTPPTTRRIGSGTRRRGAIKASRPINTRATMIRSVSTMTALPHDQEEPGDEKNARNEGDWNEAENAGDSRALDVIGLVTRVLCRGRAQGPHGRNTGEHGNPKERRDTDRGNGNQLHEQRVIATVMLGAEFDRGIEENRVAGEEEGLRTDDPGNPLVEKVIFVLDTTPNFFKRMPIIPLDR